MSDVAEVKAAVAQVTANLPLPHLREALDTLGQQRASLTEALTGTANEEAKAALAHLGAVADEIRRAIDAYRAAVARCDDYLAVI